MKKFSIALALIAAMVMIAGSAMAVPFGDGGDALQAVLDNITDYPPSSIDVVDDEISDAYDSVWRMTATGGGSATMIIELADFAEDNILGIYNPYNISEKVLLFTGDAAAGDTVQLEMKPGLIEVDGVAQSEAFGPFFGFYLDSTANAGGGMWYSDTAHNSDGTDHMTAYQGEGDAVTLPGCYPGEWTDEEFVLAFEDLDADISCDYDYTDMVVMVESMNPVPEPGTLLLLGFGLMGLVGINRKKFRS